MTDKEYETQVALFLVDNNPDYLVRYNQQVLGKYSEVKRQIDVLLLNENDKIVVECKYSKRKVDVKIIESFISFLEDVDISRGLLITNNGVTKSVIKRIAETAINIEILNDVDLKDYDLGGMIPYEDHRAVILFAPYGWVSCGAVKELKSCCVFIPIGSHLDDIMYEGNFLYLNLSSKEYNIAEKYRKEIDYIENLYSGHKRHKIWEDGSYHFRRSYICTKKRYDIAITKKSNAGYLILHGILKPQDLKWTMTAMKKMLDPAMMLLMSQKEDN